MEKLAAFLARPLERGGEGLAPSRAAALVDELLRFFALKLRHDGAGASRVLAPSPLVDAAWRALLVMPKAYARVSKEVLDKRPSALLEKHRPTLIDYDPVAGDDEPVHRLRYEATLALYAVTYGAPPDWAWPPPPRAKRARSASSGSDSDGSDISDSDGSDDVSSDSDDEPVAVDPVPLAIAPAPVAVIPVAPVAVAPVAVAPVAVAPVAVAPAPVAVAPAPVAVAPAPKAPAPKAPAPKAPAPKAPAPKSKRMMSSSFSDF